MELLLIVIVSLIIGLIIGFISHDFVCPECKQDIEELESEFDFLTNKPKLHPDSMYFRINRIDRIE
jgi:uncharacterized membrane-anchored protein YhcB (DUF1043 family)